MGLSAMVVLLEWSECQHGSDQLLRPTWEAVHLSGGGNRFPKVMPISFFKRLSLFEVFQERKFREMLAISYLALQACILFLRRFRQEWSISVFVLFRRHTPTIAAEKCPDCVPVTIWDMLSISEGSQGPIFLFEVHVPKKSSTEQLRHGLPDECGRVKHKPVTRAARIRWASSDYVAGHLWSEGVHLCLCLRLCWSVCACLCLCSCLFLHVFFVMCSRLVLSFVSLSTFASLCPLLPLFCLLSPSLWPSLTKHEQRVITSSQKKAPPSNPWANLTSNHIHIPFILLHLRAYAFYISFVSPSLTTPNRDARIQASSHHPVETGEGWPMWRRSLWMEDEATCREVTLEDLNRQLFTTDVAKTRRADLTQVRPICVCILNNQPELAPRPATASGMNSPALWLVLGGSAEVPSLGHCIWKTNLSRRKPVSQCMQTRCPIFKRVWMIGDDFSMQHADE